MAFLPDGTFALTIGEEISNIARKRRTEFRSRKDSPPELGWQRSQVNPFVGQAGVRPENLYLGPSQRTGFRPDVESGRLYEHRAWPASGGDELNIIVARRNYGWPVITYGMDYSGAYVSPYTQRPGLEQPVTSLDAVDRAVGTNIAFADGFPRGGDLSSGLWRLPLAPRSFRRARQRTIKSNCRMIRTGELTQAPPDGYLYVCTDEPDGHVPRLERADSPAARQRDSIAFCLRPRAHCLIAMTAVVPHDIFDSEGTPPWSPASNSRIDSIQGYSKIYTGVFPRSNAVQICCNARIAVAPSAAGISSRKRVLPRGIGDLRHGGQAIMHLPVGGYG